MKSALLVSLIAAALVAGSPAIACRANTVAPARPVPSIEERIVFTAVIESRERDDCSALHAGLRVQRRLLGETPDLVMVNRQGVCVQSEDGVVYGLCIRYLPFESALTRPPLGSEVVVLAAPGSGRWVDVLDMALADTDRGRELRALANP